MIPINNVMDALRVVPAMTATDARNIVSTHNNGSTPLRQLVLIHTDTSFSDRIAASRIVVRNLLSSVKTFTSTECCLIWLSDSEGLTWDPGSSTFLLTAGSRFVNTPSVLSNNPNFESDDITFFVMCDVEPSLWGFTLTDLAVHLGCTPTAATDARAYSIVPEIYPQEFSVSISSSLSYTSQCGSNSTGSVDESDLFPMQAVITTDIANANGTIVPVGCLYGEIASQDLIDNGVAPLYRVVFWSDVDNIWDVRFDTLMNSVF